MYSRALRIIHSSHPRLWPYIGFLFLFGVLAGWTEAADMRALLAYGSWFTVGLSMFGFLVNDYFDRDLDAHNPRKRPFILSAGEAFGALAAVLAALALIYYSFPSLTVASLIVIALGANLLYSAPPIRFKRTPFIDILIGPASFFTPLLAGYVLAAHALPPLTAVLGGTLFFGGIELAHKSLDIEADIRGGIRTSATVLGARSSLLIALLLVAGAAACIGMLDPRFALGALPYALVLAGVQQWRTHPRIDRFLPYAYSAAGFIVTAGYLFLR